MTTSLSTHKTRGNCFQLHLRKKIKCCWFAKLRVLDSTTTTIMPEPSVCVSIVTYNSSRYIRRCLEAVLDQRDVSLDVVVVDNASSDDTVAILESFAGSIRLIRNSTNTGFAAA